MCVFVDSLGVSLLINHLGNSIVPLPGEGEGAAGPRVGDDSVGNINIDRGMSQLGSLLVGETPSSHVWALNSGAALPISGLGTSNSLNGSLNAYMQVRQTLFVCCVACWRSVMHHARWTGVPMAACTMVRGLAVSRW